MSVLPLEPPAGAFSWAKNKTRNVLAIIRANPFWGSLLMEFVGANLVSVSCTGSKAERLEQCIMQFGNTLQTFIGGLFVEKAFDAIYKKAIPNFEEAMKTPDGKAWYKFGKSIAMIGYITPFMLVLPKIRDIYTLKTTGAITFDEMTGYTKFNRDDPEHKKREQAEIHKKWRQIGTVIGTGFTACMGLYAMAGWAMAKEKKYPKWMDNIERAEISFKLPWDNTGKTHTWGLPGFVVGDKKNDAGQWEGNRSIFLKDGKFSNFAGGHLMMSWVLPGYGGWLLEGRGALGVFEDVFKATWAVSSFSGLKSGIVKKFEESVEKVPFLKKGFEQWFGPEENRHYFSSEFVGTAVYALPVLLSFGSRGIRAKLFGFNGQQHDIPAVPIENYVDTDENQTSGAGQTSRVGGTYQQLVQGMGGKQTYTRSAMGLMAGDVASPTPIKAMALPFYQGQLKAGFQQRHRYLANTLAPSFAKI